MKPSEVDLSEAGNLYLIANTPTFLVRRLQSDSSVEVLSKSCKSDDLYGELEDALQADPADTVAAVRPFAYLLALRNQNSSELFSKAAGLRSPYHPWYPIATQLLVASFIPFVNECVLVRPENPTILQSSVSTTPSEFSNSESLWVSTCSK
jgi:hypothetical protein